MLRQCSATCARPESHCDVIGEAEAAGSSPGPSSSSSTREAKLAKLVETLKGRLEVLRGENAQLEELLLAADNRASGVAPQACLVERW